LQRVRPGTGYKSLQERLAAQITFNQRRLKRDALAAQLIESKAQRVVIDGGPRRGKSEIAKKIAADGRRYHHGDELRDRPEWAGLTKEEKWSAGSQLASEWLDEEGPYVLDNVAMGRALRKWLKRNPTGKPADVVVHLSGAVIESSSGQEGMATGSDSVWKEIRSELVMRGVRVIED
jgi:hypothetical protein